ncbi:MAG: DUF3800 domain-containing protein [Spirochaetota bacterium]
MLNAEVKQHDYITTEYIMFTDESYITDSRYRSLSAFSFKKSKYKEFCNSIRSIMLESGIKEFKWQKLKDAKYYFCAEKLIDFVLNNILTFDLRVDTIVWDTQDSRHNVKGRDDMANYERMFFHLLNHAIKQRPRGSRWLIFPDEKNGIDWDTISKCLDNKGKKQELVNTIFGSFFTDSYYSIEDFKEKKSHDEYPIQIADLFSGMAVFSRNNFDCYQSYIDSRQPLLFCNKEYKLSNREKYRCKLLEYFNNECKNKKLGVSLENKRGLYTFDPKNPINFWHYEPQGDYDKAPTRKEK